MKEKLILFFFLISYSNCLRNIILVPIKSNSMTELPTSEVNYFYITIDNSKRVGNINIYFEDNNFYLNTNLYFYYTYNNPISSSINNYNFNDYKKPIETDTSTKIRNNNYIFPYSKTKSTNLYYIFKYEGKPLSDSTLKVKITIDEFSKEIKNFDEAHDIGVTVSIVVGVIVGVVAISIFIVIACVLCRSRTAVRVGYIPPQPTIIVANPAAYPLSPRMQVYSANPIYS